MRYAFLNSEFLSYKEDKIRENYIHENMYNLFQ